MKKFFLGKLYITMCTRSAAAVEFHFNNELCAFCSFGWKEHESFSDCLIGLYEWIVTIEPNMQWSATIQKNCLLACSNITSWRIACYECVQRDRKSFFCYQVCYHVLHLSLVRKTKNDSLKHHTRHEKIWALLNVSWWSLFDDVFN